MSVYKACVSCMTAGDAVPNVHGNAELTLCLAHAEQVLEVPSHHQQQGDMRLWYEQRMRVFL